MYAVPERISALACLCLGALTKIPATDTHCYAMLLIFPVSEESCKEADPSNIWYGYTCKDVLGTLPKNCQVSWSSRGSRGSMGSRDSRGVRVISLTNEPRESRLIAHDLSLVTVAPLVLRKRKKRGGERGKAEGCVCSTR